MSAIKTAPGFLQDDYLVLLPRLLSTYSQLSMMISMWCVYTFAHWAPKAQKSKENFLKTNSKLIFFKYIALFLRILIVQLSIFINKNKNTVPML